MLEIRSLYILIR